MVGVKKQVSLLQGDKSFVDKVLSRRSSVSGGYPGFSGRYYAGDNVEVPFVWEEQPGKPKEPEVAVQPTKHQLSYEEEHYVGHVPFEWEGWRRSCPDSDKAKGSALSLATPNTCATPGGSSARWVKRLLWRKFSNMSKKVRRVRSEPREACGRCRVSGSDRYGSYNYFSNSDEECGRTSSGSSNSKGSEQSPVASSSSVRPLVHSSKFQILAKGLAKWVKL